MKKKMLGNIKLALYNRQYYDENIAKYGWLYKETTEYYGIYRIGRIAIIIFK